MSEVTVIKGQRQSMEAYNPSKFIIPASEPKAEVELPESMDVDFLGVDAVKEGFPGKFEEEKGDDAESKGKDEKQEKETKTYPVCYSKIEDWEITDIRESIWTAWKRKLSFIVYYNERELLKSRDAGRIEIHYTLRFTTMWRYMKAQEKENQTDMDKD
ncbi:hypothetical protein HYC85_018162 [Camellia sinensis]|uniref:Uncharacterized protein n=1 Tax=Camellia sinensis TaxID=4442 RepID=A0A7J7GV61_CAMSI|nr:hypothetical protein HYC85_018162 [Camellia sinensis]